MTFLGYRVRGTSAEAVVFREGWGSTVDEVSRFPDVISVENKARTYSMIQETSGGKKAGIPTIVIVEQATYVGDRPDGSRRVLWWLTSVQWIRAAAADRIDTARASV